MSNYINYFATSESYTYVWGKYRPAILKLMIASADGPQEYKFSDREIRIANPKQKGGYAFILKIHKGKSVNDIRKSFIAKDLLRVLQLSRKATELSESSGYEFRLDKHFVLHVTRINMQPEIPENIPAVINEPVTEPVITEPVEV